MDSQECEIAQAFTQFLSDTKFLSDPNAGLHTPSGQALLKGGLATVRYMFLSGARLTVHDMTILAAITNTEPVAEAHRGLVDKMEADWRTWAKQNGYL